MNMETRRTLFGYPVLALVLFFGAAFFGLLLVIGIVFNRE
ncbi:MAG: hypothetical protein ACI909_001317 [Planctomycetota bacterium]|jgi:hypothetical protein